MAAVREFPRSVALLTLLAVAACAASPSAVTERPGPAGAVPAGLENFYAQDLTWGNCSGYASTDSDKAALRAPAAQCARVTVPLDYAKPGGETITLGVLRVRARQRGTRIGSLLVNPGGPGASGLATAVRLARSEVGERFDLVGFDPRGIGSSEPAIRCLTDAERDADRAEDDDEDPSPGGVERAEAEQRDYGAKCVQRTGKGAAMLATVGTRDVARDLDVLRSALGDAKLTYLGYSYGTRLGSTYAESFPANVRAMVLDGALDPTQDVVAELLEQAKGFQAAFDDFVAWCVQRQDCAIGHARDKAVDVYKGMVLPLATRPIDVGDGRKLSYSDATTAVVQALYSEDLWETLNTGLSELGRNRSTTLMSLADAYLERNKDGHYSTSQDAFTAIRCVDDPRVTDPAVVLEAQRRYKEAAPFLDDGKPPSPALDACAYWPVPNTSTPHLPNVAGLPPIMVVSTTGDPATPYEAGVSLAGALGGRLVTYEATQHTAFLQGNACLDRIGVRYLTELLPPDQGARCSG